MTTRPLNHLAHRTEFFFSVQLCPAGAIAFQFCRIFFVKIVESSLLINSLFLAKRSEVDKCVLHESAGGINSRSSGLGGQGSNPTWVFFFPFSFFSGFGSLVFAFSFFFVGFEITLTTTNFFLNTNRSNFRWRTGAHTFRLPRLASKNNSPIF